MPPKASPHQEDLTQQWRRQFNSLTETQQEEVCRACRAVLKRGNKLTPEVVEAVIGLIEDDQT